MLKPLPHPDNKHLEAAEGWLGLGNWREANEELEQIAPRLRGHPFVLEVRYQIFAAAKQWAAAVEVARTLCELLPDNSLGFINYAYSLHELKRTKEAYSVLIPIVDKFSEPTIRYNLACYSCQLGNLKEAMQWLQQVMDLTDKKDIQLMALEDPDLEPLWTKISEI